MSNANLGKCSRRQAINICSKRLCAQGPVSAPHTKPCLCFVESTEGHWCFGDGQETGDDAVWTRCSALSHHTALIKNNEAIRKESGTVYS